MNMTLFQLILACSLASGPDHTRVEDLLFRVVMVTSQGSALAITDATRSRRYFPGSLGDAISRVENLLANNHDVHVGLAGLSPHHLGTFKLSSARALTPCANISIASLALEEALGTYRGRGEDALHRALSFYWSPTNPDALGAVAWAGEVLAMPAVSVSAMANSASPPPTPSYPKKSRSMFLPAGKPDRTTKRDFKAVE